MKEGQILQLPRANPEQLPHALVLLLLQRLVKERLAGIPDVFMSPAKHKPGAPGEESMLRKTPVVNRKGGFKITLLVPKGTLSRLGSQAAILRVLSSLWISALKYILRVWTRVSRLAALQFFAILASEAFLFKINLKIGLCLTFQRIYLSVLQVTQITHYLFYSLRHFILACFVLAGLGAVLQWFARV